MFRRKGAAKHDEFVPGGEEGDREGASKIRLLKGGCKEGEQNNGNRKLEKIRNTKPSEAARGLISSAFKLSKEKERMNKLFPFSREFSAGKTSSTSRSYPALDGLSYPGSQGESKDH